MVIASIEGSTLLRVNLDRREKVTIGRSEKCDIRLKGASVSRHHALLVKERGRWILLDLSSQSGIWVGQTQHRVIEVNDEDPVRLGDAFLWFFDVAHLDVPPIAPLPEEHRRYALLRSEHLERLWLHRVAPDDKAEPDGVTTPRRRSA